MGRWSTDRKVKVRLRFFSFSFVFLLDKTRTKPLQQQQQQQKWRVHFPPPSEATNQQFTHEGNLFDDYVDMSWILTTQKNWRSQKNFFGFLFCFFVFYVLRFACRLPFLTVGWFFEFFGLSLAVDRWKTAATTHLSFVRSFMSSSSSFLPHSGEKRRTRVAWPRFPYTFFGLLMCRSGSNSVANRSRLLSLIIFVSLYSYGFFKLFFFLSLFPMQLHYQINSIHLKGPRHHFRTTMYTPSQ